ncbi:DMT family transporter [Aureimonas jatrophae]|uniref:Threonine/homoserine efflux transporter RhtA n=1 Tax=Aureimonas jatrophae TaxID=1166073 RepID=A0A1H0IDC0_9HYPH|nr:DMT family transporter [Aureimonas jatrophae]MBB3952104.1 drug/metabolite transporter (DMT)-like permease [Aureimonas jatrophae]SDO29382.1 Threonine/homoserine efflux transporter RhtA [Aureimonas jatrophae]
MARFLPLAPALFVLLWATGFVGARYAMPHAEPFTFLSMRYALALLVLALLAIGPFRRARPRGRALAHAAFAGSLIHGVYLGGVFYAVRHGLPAGIVALAAGLQPLVTAVLAGPMLGERMSYRHGLGLAVGFLGVALVVSPKLGTGSAVNAGTLLPAGVAVLAIAAGTVWQKRFVRGLDLRIGTAAQYVGALVPTLAVAFLTETMRVDWTGELVFALLWLTLVLSIGAVFLLLLMIERGAVSRVASLMYLVPGVTAVMAYLLFGEALNGVQILGMALAAGGTAAATATVGARSPAAARPLA